MVPDLEVMAVMEGDIGEARLYFLRLVWARDLGREVVGMQTASRCTSN